MSQATKPTNPSRRKFVVTTAAAGGGLAIGLHLPFATAATATKGAAAAEPVEVNAWVLIKPDDTCIIRIARSEMGQGTMTGLAQLMVEELECDWNKISTEFPTPGDSLARKRVWASSARAGAAAFARRKTTFAAAAPSRA